MFQDYKVFQIAIIGKAGVLDTVEGFFVDEEAAIDFGVRHFSPTAEEIVDAQPTGEVVNLPSDGFTFLGAGM